MTLSGCLLVSLAAWTSAPEPPARGSHLWIVNELFSNADGSVQFVELWECCGSSIETNMAGKKVYSDATGNEFTFPADLTGDTAHRYLLLGTAAFAATPGAPAPDFIIPAGFFSIDADTIRWHIYPDATLSFTSGQLPTNGQLSLKRDGSVGINDPTNWAGQSGTIDLVAVPALPARWLIALAASALLVCVPFVRRR